MGKKRFNFSIDLDDNVLFEQAVSDSVNAKMKQMVREAVKEPIKSEIDRVVRAYMDDVKSLSSWKEGGSYARSVLNVEIAKAIKEYVSSESFTKMLQDSVDAAMQKSDFTAIAKKAISTKMAKLFLED